MNTLQKRENIIYEYNDKIRIKTTDKCNLSCPFCHYEGTKRTEAISLSDDNFTKWIKELKFYFNKVHLTGGEPTLYNDLLPLCRYLKFEGYEVFLTTNLLVLNNNLIDSISYISRINVSLHTFNPEYFKFFVNNKTKADVYIDIIKNNILNLKRNIKDIAINSVVSSDNRQELEQILLFCQENKILLKLVPDWRYIKEAKEYILNLLQTHGFVEEKRTIRVPGSNLRILYKNRDYYVEFKDIEPYYLDFLCNSCKLKASCIEKFAFLRLEGNPLRFKVCIGKPAMSCASFEKDFWPSYKNLVHEVKNNIVFG